MHSEATEKHYQLLLILFSVGMASPPCWKASIARWGFEKHGRGFGGVVLVSELSLCPSCSHVRILTLCQSAVFYELYMVLMAGAIGSYIVHFTMKKESKTQIHESNDQWEEVQANITILGIGVGPLPASMAGGGSGACGGSGSTCGGDDGCGGVGRGKGSTGEEIVSDVSSEISVSFSSLVMGKVLDTPEDSS
ncbi:hypothetical protein EDD17DRAFT_1504599 [Pisolithus thermaeus]|nr:hypothetical protein EDD17DRAFT_1504599 [Pisolithus thermaeus]